MDSGLKPNLRRSFPGQFLAHSLSPRVWRLTRSRPPIVEILVQGPELDAAQAINLASCAQLSLEWRASGVLLRLESSTEESSIRAESAIVHEAQPRLYEGLPLADFDAATRQFWQRIFRIVRIPGGRYLLGFLARRSRSSA